MIRTTEISLKKCLAKLEQMANLSKAFTDDIPEILQEDFKEFIKGHTLSKLDGREITYDMKMYYNKVMNQGISYNVQWSRTAGS